MRLRLATRSVDADGLPRRIWSCPEVGCDTVAGAHPDGTPMGVPGDRDTRRARQRAHHEFDRWWRGHGLSRDTAYLLLQRLVRKHRDDAHIAKFTRLECLSLVVLLRAAGGSRAFLNRLMETTWIPPERAR